MIDTDKYEGHTPAPWKINEIHSSQRWTGRKPVDVLLAEDAPLLLEEVKRLRLAIQNVADFPKRCPPALKLKGVIDAMVCMLREAIE